MQLFSEVFKLYSYKNKDRCDLSIKVNNELVLTFKLTHDELSKILSGEAEFNSSTGSFWYVTKKKKFECFRITVHAAGVDFNFRVSYNDFEKLGNDYKTQMSNPMPWDNK